MDWQAYWDERAKLEGPEGSGWGASVRPMELFAHLASIAEHLELKPRDVLLDVGCGTGEIGLHLARHVKVYAGMDSSRNAIEALEACGRGIPNLMTVCASITEMPALSVDKILCSSVLQYLEPEDVGTALRQLRKVVTPGGRCLCSLNPDARIKDQYLAGCKDPERRALNEAALWFDQATLLRQANAAGWRAHIKPVDDRIWQSWYMFDLVMEAK